MRGWFGSIRGSFGIALLVGAWLNAASVSYAEPPAKISAPAAPSPRAAAMHSPVEPADSLAVFEMPEGLRVELVAAEPEVVDPVAARFDEQGRLWVVEMRDYPLGPAKGEPPRSQIKLLEDRDGDGRYEHATVFADHLLFPTGIQPWKGGIFVTLAGRVAYLKDTDGDGRADLNETWYTGFAEENSQLRANHPTLGPDGWIYVAGGLRGGKIKSALHPDAVPIDISGRDFRFDPNSRECEAVVGNGQFGLTFDDVGRRFVCSNRNPLVQVMLEERYLKRNPLLAVATVVNDVAASGEASRVFPKVDAWTTSNLHAGQFTAACGVHIYRGDALPEKFYGAAFTCEPTGSLVHCEVFEPSAGPLKSRPLFADCEFLASRDPWFRPVNLETGSDGALYVVDMYRAVIEHPDWMPTELKHRADLMLGNDRGRIYRITAKNVKSAPTTMPKDRSTDEWAKLLDSKNGWWRDTAARKILEAHERTAGVEEVTRHGHMAGRIAALRVLNNTGGLPKELLSETLRDSEPSIREVALRIATPEYLAEHFDPQQSAADAEKLPGSLRLQLALSLGDLKPERRVEPLANLLMAQARDPKSNVAANRWLALAAATSASRCAGGVLVELLKQSAPGPADGKAAKLRIVPLDAVVELARLVGVEREAEHTGRVFASLEAVSEHRELRFAILTAFAEGTQRGGHPLRAAVSALNAQAQQQIALIEHTAATTAADAHAAPGMRKRAVEVLATADFGMAKPILSDLIQNSPDDELRRQAIVALAAHDDPTVGPLLLAGFAERTPSMRGALLDALLRSPERTKLLLEEVAAGRIAAADLDPVRTQQLLHHPDETLRKRAEKLLAVSIPQDRQKILAEYQACLMLKPAPEKGREVFRRNCATCHRVGDIGVDVGPNISDLRDKQPTQLLGDILQPSRAIDTNYVCYAVITRDGQSLTGLISAETSGSITLKMPEAKTKTLLRADIEQIHSTGLSLMPEGLERTVSQQDMADLIGYVKGWRYLPAGAPAPAP